MIVERVVQVRTGRELILLRIEQLGTVTPDTPHDQDPPVFQQGRRVTVARLQERRSGGQPTTLGIEQIRCTSTLPARSQPSGDQHPAIREQSGGQLHAGQAGEHTQPAKRPTASGLRLEQIDGAGQVAARDQHLARPQQDRRVSGPTWEHLPVEAEPLDPRWFGTWIDPVRVAPGGEH